MTERQTATDASAGSSPGVTPGARLEVEKLRVVIAENGADVIDDVSFTVRSGETLGLVGESGSGKSTVAVALLGYARRGLWIAGGQVRIDGQNVLALPSNAMRALRGTHVAYVPQDPSSALNPALKVGSQLRAVLRSHSGGAATDERVTELLEAVSLPAGRILDAYPHQLSGGQQQRVVLAMGFSLRPAVIVLDEPTSGVDVTTQRHILDTVRVLCSSYGVAAIFVSHDLAVTGELVDHVAVMYAGRIVELGRARDVFGDPSHPYTRGLLRAVPSAVESRAIVGLQGHPPRPGDRPSGCFFAPRCTFVQERCIAAQPPLVARGTRAHEVRCVRVAELTAYSTAHDDRPVDRTIGSDAATEVLLEVTDLSASYGRTPVLEGIALTVNAGECLAIVGESGSGKTTLAQCVVGLHNRFSGEVRLSGLPVPCRARDRSGEQLRAIQYVFQNPFSSLNPRRSVQQILEQPLERFSSLNRKERTARLIAALEDAALDGEFRHRYPPDLSGGERQRVAIARALVVGPALIVCDEITSALDVSVQAAVIETLRRLQSERHVALIFITHNLALMHQFADRILVMRSGRVVEAGAAKALLEHPQDNYTQRLLRDIPHDPGQRARAALRPISAGAPSHDTTVPAIVEEAGR